MQSLTPMGDEEKFNSPKNAEEELTKSENHYRVIIETATDAIIQCLNGKITFWNKAAEKIFKYKSSEIIGKPISVLIPKEEIAVNHQKGLEKYIKTGKSKIIGKKPCETLAKRKDGIIIPVELSLADNKSKYGHSFTGILRDISDRKKAEEELQKAYKTANKIAVTLQKSMLPRDIPKIENLEIKFYYQATGEGEVGGDFYDVFETALGSYGILIGDVSGKGIEVAAETARVKYLFRDRAFASSSPSKVMYDVNNSLAKQKNAHFTALTYALYNPANSIIEITNAGNPYPYNSKTEKFLEISGIPMSLISNQKYISQIVKLKAEDILLFYTDGIVEARQGNELFGEDRVRTFIKKNKHLTLNNLLKSLVDKARVFSKNNLRDDILVVAIKKH